MSWQATKWAMDLGLPLVPGAVLKSLAYHADKKGFNARPGIKRICFEAGLAERAVQKNLRLLEMNGLIERTKHGQGGRQMRTDYRLLMDENPVPETPFLTTHRDKPRISRQETPSLATRNPASHDIPIKEGTVIEPSIEPSITLPALSAPAFYDALLELPTFDEPLAKCVQWIEANDVSAARAEETALAMVARLTWNDKKSRYEYLDAGGKTRTYTAVWPTFRSWAKREPLSTNGRYSNRGRRVEELPGKEAFKEPWL